MQRWLPNAFTKDCFRCVHREVFLRILRSLAASVLCVVAGPSLAAVTLVDGGFEGATQSAGRCDRIDGNLPMAWSDNSCWNRGARVLYEPTVSPSRSGKSLMVTLSGGTFQLVQGVRLEPSARHHVSVWLRAERPMVVKLSLRMAASPYMDVAARSVRVDDRWTRVEVSGYSHGLWAPDLRDALFMVSSSTPGVVWVDEAAMKVERLPLTLPLVEVPAAFFGTHIMHQLNVSSGMVESTAGSVRIWDSHKAQWHQVQRMAPTAKRRDYDWSALDERVRLAEKRSVPLLMVLGGYAPAWASLPEGADVRDAPDCFRCDQTPSRLSDWTSWVSDVVGRYRGRSIKAWEIWNEPSFPRDHVLCPSADSCRSGLGSMYRGTPEQLLALQDSAAAIIKRQDPDALVVSPGVSYHHRNFLDHYLDIGGGRSADVIGYHLYVDGVPELMMAHVLGVRAIMRDHGLDQKPLWNTESAISEINLDLDPAVQYARRHGLPLPTLQELGSAYLARVFLISWAAGVQRHYHYAWDDQHRWPSSPTQVRSSDNAVVEVNDVGRTFAQIRQWLVGRRLVTMDTGDASGVWRAGLQGRDGSTTYVLWSPARPSASPVKVAMPEGMRRRCQLDGRCADVSGAGLSVDFRPVLVTP